MLNPFLNDKSLVEIVEFLDINEKIKSFLISKIPQLESKERGKLFDILIEIFFRDLPKEKVIEKLKKSKIICEEIKL